MASNIPGTEGESRLKPMPWDYSSYTLRCLKRSLNTVLDSEAARIREKGAGGSTVTVLDYGCGTRPYEPLFRQLGMKYIGADLRDNSEADIPIEPGRPLDVESGTIDILFSSQVLEHVPDVSGYLEECRRVLKPNGLLLLSTHGFWTYHGYPDDFHRWTFQGLKREIEEQGFAVTRLLPCVGPLAYTTHLRTQLVRGLLYRFAPLTLPLIGLVNVVSAFLMPIEDFITPGQVKYENSAIYVVEARNP